MKALTTTFRPAHIAAAVAAAALLPLGAQAQEASMSELQARYKDELQRCATIANPESQQACRREAGAALQEARRNRLTTGANTPVDPATRCARLPSQQRTDCERLMTDSGTVQYGSVSGGGVLRELTITVPAPAADAPAGTYTAPGTQGYVPQTAPVPGYGAQPVPAPAPATGGYGGSYSGTTGSAPGTYGTQPIR